MAIDQVNLQELQRLNDAICFTLDAIRRVAPHLMMQNWYPQFYGAQLPNVPMYGQQFSPFATAMQPQVGLHYGNHWANQPWANQQWTGTGYNYPTTPWNFGGNVGGNNIDPFLTQRLWGVGQNFGVQQTVPPMFNQPVSQFVTPNIRPF